MNEKLFQKNLEIWAKNSPIQAYNLPYIDTSHLTFCHTKAGELNLKTHVDDQTVYFHSEQGAVQEAEKFFEQQNLRKTMLLYVFGVGLGYLYPVAKKWLKRNKKRQLIFLEKDLAVIHRLFETELATQIVSDPQVNLIYFKNFQDSEQTFENLYWNNVMSSLKVSALPLYEKRYPEIFSDLQQKIAYDAAVKNALVDEYLRYGGAFFINFYQNMLCLGDSYLGNRFFGQYTGVPAIICGAGPSLDKSLPQLGALLDKAVVFAGGSALNALNSFNLQPHFGAGIDPNRMQYARLSTNQGYEVPFFYRNRMFHNAFQMIHGPRLYITGCGGYDIAEYFEEKFDIKAGFLDEGHNVVNFCVEVAYAMGCNPIIFVGMDLAYTGMKAYAPGVVEDAAVKETEIVDQDDYDAKTLIRKDINGDPTHTLWKWIAESEWIGQYARTHQLIKMVNCTEGGIGFPGVPNHSLKETAEKYLTRTFELNNRIHGDTQNSLMPQVTYRRVAKALRELADSLKRSEEYLTMLMEENVKATEKIQQGGDYHQIQTGRAALAETELDEEVGYQYVISVFNVVTSRILSRELHEINTSKGSEKKKVLKKLALNLKKLKFLKEVAQVNLKLIDYAFEERKKKQKKRKKLQVSPAVIGTYKIENQRLTIVDPEMGLTIEAPFSEEGRSYIYYLGGIVKEELYYKNGLLHGPATYWSEKGKVLAKSWFVEGQQQGKSWWYYPSGALYSVQRHRDGLWHGRQEYYFEDGTAKTIMEYKHGVLLEKPLLF